MGMFSFVLSVVAILIAGAAFGLQLTSSDFDPNSCTILNSGSSGAITPKSCDEICGQKQCLSGLSKFIETQNPIDQIPTTTHQSSFVSCNEQVGVGTLIELDESESQSLSCICCG
jgi:hypothetical protein